MKKTIAVENFDQMRSRKLARARLLDTGTPIEPEARLTFESVEDLVMCLTPRRVHILKAARKKPMSISELALSVARNRTAVQRDLKVLHKFGLVRMTKRTNPGHGQIQVVQATAGRLTVWAQV